MKTRKPDNQKGNSVSVIRKIELRRARLTNLGFAFGIAWLILLIIAIFVEVDLFIPIMICSVSFVVVDFIQVAEDKGFYDGLRYAEEVYKEALEKELKNH